MVGGSAAGCVGPGSSSGAAGTTFDCRRRIVENALGARPNAIPANMMPSATLLVGSYAQLEMDDTSFHPIARRVLSLEDRQGFPT